MRVAHLKVLLGRSEAVDLFPLATFKHEKATVEHLQPHSLSLISIILPQLSPGIELHELSSRQQGDQ